MECRDHEAPQVVLDRAHHPSHRAGGLKESRSMPVQRGEQQAEGHRGGGRGEGQRGRPRLARDLQRSLTPLLHIPAAALGQLHDVARARARRPWVKAVPAPQRRHEVHAGLRPGCPAVRHRQGVGAVRRAKLHLDLAALIWVRSLRPLGQDTDHPSVVWRRCLRC